MSFQGKIGLEHPSIYISFAIQDGKNVTYTLGSDQLNQKTITLPIGDQIIEDQYGRGYVLYKQSSDSFQFGDYNGTAIR